VRVDALQTNRGLFDYCRRGTEASRRRTSPPTDGQTQQQAPVSPVLRPRPLPRSNRQPRPGEDVVNISDDDDAFLDESDAFLDFDSQLAATGVDGRKRPGLEDTDEFRRMGVKPALKTNTRNRTAAEPPWR
jgi:hypothetical protein